MKLRLGLSGMKSSWPCIPVRLTPTSGHFNTWTWHKERKVLMRLSRCWLIMSEQRTPSPGLWRGCAGTGHPGSPYLNKPGNKQELRRTSSKHSKFRRGVQKGRINTICTWELRKQQKISRKFYSISFCFEEWIHNVISGSQKSPII